MDLTQIKKIASEQMENERSHPWKERGNKYYHGERTAKLAVTLRSLIFPEDSSHDGILTVAAWFHDIANGVDEHGIKGAEKTRELIFNLCSPAELDEICGIIAVHDDRSSDRTLFSDWAKLHQDADFLDHVGTYDVWMNFLYAVPHEKTINEISDYMVNERPEVIARCRKELNYELSRVIYDEKAEYQKSFTDRFSVELSGQIWKLEEIVSKRYKAEETV